MTRGYCCVALAAVLSACSTMSEDATGPEPERFRQEVGFVRAWEASAGEQPAAQGYGLVPAVAEGRVYLAGAEGELRALDAATGEPLWRTELDLRPSGGPAIGQGVLVIGTREGVVVGLDPQQGQELWRAQVGGEVLAPPDVGAGVVAVHVTNGHVVGLDPASGTRLWSFDQTPPALTLRGVSRPLILAQPRAVVVGLDNGKLVALDPASGRPVWDAVITVPSGRSDLDRMADVDADPVAADGDIYAVGYQGRVVAVESYTGRIKWQQELSSHQGLDVDPVNVYVVDADNRVTALSRANGAIVWRQEDLAGVPLTAPAVAGDFLVVGDAEGYLNWLGLDEGRLLRREPVGAPVVARPVLDGGRLYVLTTRGLRVLRSEP